MSDTEATWAAKTDDEFVEASGEFFEYTEEGERVIRAGSVRGGYGVSSCSRSLDCKQRGSSISSVARLFQDLFGAGRVGGYNYVTGPAEFWVRAHDAERAGIMFDGLGARPPQPADDPNDDA